MVKYAVRKSVRWARHNRTFLARLDAGIGCGVTFVTLVAPGACVAFVGAAAGVASYRYGRRNKRRS
jgi:hypothetical protein